MDEQRAKHAQVTVSPGDRATGVSPKEPISTSVAGGRFESVALTDPDGNHVAGQLSPNGMEWTSTEPLAYGARYTWEGRAIGNDGVAVPVRGSFETARPSTISEATISPTDGSEVGIAMPIRVKFDEPVRDKAAVQRALDVRTSVPVEGAWAWLSDTQLDWRPKEYWPAHTDVEVEANLYGVHFGDGVYGESDATSHFTIGRAQVVKADVNSLELVVERDGAEYARYPASYGRASDPNLNTPNGIYTVMAKLPVENMSNPAYGYTNVKKTWAVRMSNHGEYIHENSENAGNIGVVNNTHGCINLSAANAKDYFDSALIGDPVEVTGSGKDMPPGYDIYDWMLTWDQWLEKSAA